MRLFFIVPKDIERLQFWFLVEGFFLLMNYPIALAALWITPKLRLHLHFRIIAEFIWTQYMTFLIARTILLAYQWGFFSFDKPENNSMIVVCSWFRTFYPTIALTGYGFGSKTEAIVLPFWIIVEREFSFFFIYDYEYHSRLWIPLSILLIDIITSAISVSFYTFEVLPVVLLLISALLLGAASGIAYLYQYWRSYTLNNALKNRRPCRLRYSLNVRYQLEENLWFTRILRNGIIGFVFIGLSVGVTFVLSKMTYFKEETQQILDCIFNITCAVDGPILLFAVLLQNKYFIGKFKLLFFKAPKPPHEEEGDVYFIQLMHQWEEPLEVEHPRKKQLMSR